MFVAAALGAVGLVADLAWNRQLDLPATPALLLGMLFFSGVQLFSLGLIAEYIGHIHFQVRKRPLVVERGRLNFTSADAARSVLHMKCAVTDDADPELHSWAG
jgi:hypothetical protein